MDLVTKKTYVNEVQNKMNRRKLGYVLLNTFSTLFFVYCLFNDALPDANLQNVE
jgi:hypothetical protein